MFTLNLNEYRSSVLGCWMGKNIGGTLGAPMEWSRQKNDISFYVQKLTGDPAPNDDLDLQLIWLLALEDHGPDVTAQTLMEYWLLYITPYWSEYGNAKVNLGSGLLPPLSGSLNNPYKDSCGAFIRSEIWACIAPGCPHRAAQYAYEDAIVDHGEGEGTYAEVFCAAMESAAFVQKDAQKLIDIGLTYIPGDCGVAKAVLAARQMHKAGMSLDQARDEVLRNFRGMAAPWAGISKEDVEKGFRDGKEGYDVPSNMAFLVIGLLYGAGDFAKTLCSAVYCGEDTDCTAATLGSLLGIMNGFESIPQDWIKPIGRGIKTVALSLGDCGGRLPGDIDNLAARTEKMAMQVIGRFNLPVRIAHDKPTDLAGLSLESLNENGAMAQAYANLNGPVFKFGLLDVGVDYLGAPTISNNVPKTIRLNLWGMHGHPLMANVHVYTPQGWSVSPNHDVKVFLRRRPRDPVAVMELTFQTPQVQAVNRAVVEITGDGKPSAMLVPIMLLASPTTNPTSTPQG